MPNRKAMTSRSGARESAVNATIARMNDMVPVPSRRRAPKLVQRRPTAIPTATWPRLAIPAL